MKFLFWTSIGLIFYTYCGYPALLFLLAKVLRNTVDKSLGEINTMVTVVIAVRNEAFNIKKRIKNLLEQDYPARYLEIIVVSDGSTDATADIVNGCKEEVTSGTQLKLIEYPSQRGKSYALNIGVESAVGNIVIFTDARQQFRKDAITELVRNFHDQKVGCVSGELIFYKDSDSTIQEEMETYWNYEKFVRKLESGIHSVCGATGSIYAIRKSLFKKMPEGLLLDDVYIPMNIVLQGYRTIFEGNAVAYDHVSADFQAEKRRKIRTLVGNWQLLRIMPSIVLPWINPIACQYISHKFMRLIIPFCFAGYILGACFIHEPFYQAILWTTILMFLMPFVENLFEGNSVVVKIAKISRTVFNLNYYAFLSFLNFIKRKENVWIR